LESTAESKNKKRRIGGFDIFVIIVIIAAIVGGGYYYLSSRSTPKETLTYEIGLKDVPEYVVPSILVGDRLTDGTDSYDMGTITDIISNTIMTSVFPDADKGIYKEVSSPENRRLVIVKVVVPYAVKGGGSKNIENFNLGGTLDIKVGKTLVVKSSSYMAQGDIVAIDSY
jgi:hypothetical protein